MCRMGLSFLQYAEFSDLIDEETFDPVIEMQNIMEELYEQICKDS